MTPKPTPTNTLSTPSLVDPTSSLLVQEQRGEFERCQKDIENENSKVFEVAIPTDEEFQVDSKISEVEHKITDLQAELASLKAHRADLATKREQNTRERMDRLEVRTKELIARRLEIDEINRQRAYLQFQIDQLSVEVESWNDYLPPRKEADNSDDTDGDDGEGEENS
ncbi:TNFAIP3-interacting protein 1 isoform 5 [Corchorus olitorius]|uniref:TNFAIP3-interacting protein 1 isoform 5 n=1 Tax=Corchorus olitorius TaxID=93759 RepID=A0A1R3L4W2_9ROSI|nr:TNFAIP3-interacting protein 1 isoform 5 [Corchorus olitorius]